MYLFLREENVQRNFRAQMDNFIKQPSLTYLLLCGWLARYPLARHSLLKHRQGLETTPNNS